jgi:hypothetical protein
MSTWPFWMNGSRLAETVSVHSIASASMPSSPATIRAISTSKPSGSPVCGLSRPKPGWSYFVPTVIDPASLSSAIVVPASKSTSSATSAVFSAASSACCPASLEQPARTRPRAPTAAA